MKTSKLITLAMLLLGLLAGVTTPNPLVATAHAGKPAAAVSPFAGEWSTGEFFNVGVMTISTRGRIDGSFSSWEGPTSFTGSVSPDGELQLTYYVGPLGKKGLKIVATGTAHFDVNGDLVLSLVSSDGDEWTEVWESAD